MASKKRQSLDLIPQKHMLLFFAALTFVLMVIMAYSMNAKKVDNKTITYEEEISQLKSQSDGDDINSIESDLGNTNLQDLDKEVEDILNELE